MKRSLLRLMVGLACVVLSGSLGCSAENERDPKDETPAELVDRCLFENGGCGDVASFACTDGVNKDPVCVDLRVDICATDNGGCGDAAFVACTDGVGQEPTCAVLDVCVTDNGGCGAEEYFSCTDGVGQEPTCAGLDLCATDNGGCGAEEYFSCTDGVGQEPTCAGLDLCATDNGGCGAEAYFSCTDGVGQEPTCDALDLCATDNGGCGDVADFSCTDGVGQEPTCAPLHACVVDNGGCGDPAEYACYPGEESEPVVCRILGECVIAEVIIEPEIAVSLSKYTGLVSDDLTIELRGRPGWNENYVLASEIYLRFDLSTVPAGMRIDEAILQMTSFTGHAVGDNGNVYIHRIDNAWTVDELRWDTRPAWLDTTPLGHWWAWYNGNIAEVLRQANTPEMVSAVDAAILDDQMLSLNLYSIGYRSKYRTLTDPDPAKRPRMIVRERRCNQVLLTAEAEVSVAAAAANTVENGELLVEAALAETYLKFNLSYLPVGAKIVDARLSMVAFNGQGTGPDDEVFTTFVADDSWGVEPMSWDTRLTAESTYYGSWLLDYAVDPSDDVIEKPVVNNHFGLIPLIQQEYDGDQTLSLRIHADEGMSKYYGRTNATPANRPNLLVTYELP